MGLPTLHGERVTLRPLREDDLDVLAGFVASPGAREWWASSADPEALREELRNDGHAFAIEVDGALAGWLGFEEESEPEYPSVGLDITLGPDHRGRALGPDALRAAIEWFGRERGHHRFTIDPAADNERAIRAYESVGFRRVGVLRQYQVLRGGVRRDGLLMDLLAEELPPGAARPEGA